jgi:leucyl aminopeptidase
MIRKDLCRFANKNPSGSWKDSGEFVISFESLAGGALQARADLLVLPCYAGAGPGRAQAARTVRGPAASTVSGPAAKAVRGPATGSAREVAPHLGRGAGLAQQPLPDPGREAAEAGRALGIDLEATLRAHGFCGEVGDMFATLSLGRLGAESVLFLGLGPREGADHGALRQASMLAAAETARAARVAVVLPEAVAPADAGRAAAALGEGLLLGSYRCDRYRRDPVVPHRRPAVLEHVQVLTSDAARAPAAAGLRRGQLTASLTNWVRDLVNASPSDVTPEHMAEQAMRLARAHALTCTVLGPGELAAGGFGGILGVGQGSANEPRLVELSYRGGGDGPVIGLTGKGITFDSGGLSLKRTAEIEWMKSDMAGAATIMAVLRGAAELGLAVNIDAALPFAENMPGGSAQRPGDVLTQRNGTTCEVRDTDSEGRLVVADALAYLAELGPSVLVDVATLTDAAGLGESMWAVLGTDDELIGELLDAGQEAGDPGWQLPLPSSYLRYLASDVADIRNTPAGGVQDTTIMAAMYLAEFTAGLPWMHIDNGSTAYRERPGDGWPEGATGSPVRALLRWIEHRALNGAGQAVAGVGG